MSDTTDHENLPRFPSVDSTASLMSAVPFSPSHSKKCCDFDGLMPAPSVRKRTNSFNHTNLESSEAKVLVIYTGGTIGMIRNEKNALEPKPNHLLKTIRKYPHMHDDKYAHKRFGGSSTMAPLVLPYVEGLKRRIVYTITEYEQLLDSSNMTVREWVRIAEDIQQSYEFFDGFVVLHGTDTLSYTASALSFMFENLGKTVIITGSQIPIFDTRTDGSDNFTSALILAGNYVIPEVCVFFNAKLLRGNRTIKISSHSLDAFDTPNVPCLVKMGIHVDVDYRSIFRSCTVEKFRVHTQMDENVGLLRIFPSISLATVKAFLKPPMKGVALQTYGSGNVPTNRDDIMSELKQACERGLLVVNCTQCIEGSVSDLYETGRAIYSLGIIPGFDMTPEAALAKLSYVLSKSEWSIDVKKSMMRNNLRGELTSGKAIKELQEFDLIDAVARTLNLSAPREISQLGATLFPAMLNTSVLAGDIEKINTLKGYGADLSTVNSDNRTALHIACCEGNEEVVRYLLINGVNVHIRDRYDRTALMEAVSRDHHSIIKLLLKCGAHITGSSRAVGEHLCGAAARGMLLRLESYSMAGADLSLPDPTGRTALHIAALTGNVDMVQFLLKNYAECDAIDLLGLKPLDYAKRGGTKEIVEMISFHCDNRSESDTSWDEKREM